jgi:hypothetical protein
MHMRHANGCMHGDAKWMMQIHVSTSNRVMHFAIFNMQKRIFWQHQMARQPPIEKNACWLGSFQNARLSLIPCKLDAKMHARLEREFWPRYAYGHAKCICMPICTVDWAQPYISCSSLLNFQ